jgi:hypothetical protein
LQHPEQPLLRSSAALPNRLFGLYSRCAVVGIFFVGVHMGRAPVEIFSAIEIRAFGIRPPVDDPDFLVLLGTRPNSSVDFGENEPMRPFPLPYFSARCFMGVGFGDPWGRQHSIPPLAALGFPGGGDDHIDSFAFCRPYLIQGRDSPLR